MSRTEPLLEIAGLHAALRRGDGSLLPLLRGIDLAIGPGESLGIVGESGSGKSTLALSAMGYLRPGVVITAGSVRFAGMDMFSPAAMALRGGRLALIPQNAGQALTPTLRVGPQIAEALRLHSPIPAADRPARVIDLLAKVRLPTPADIADRYPPQLSGGQQQRVAIAMALAGEPAALLLDEPTTGLDVTTQAHVLDLLQTLARERGLAMVYVSHDLGAVARVCDRVAVMYAGEIIAEGTARHILRTPPHPYARGLIAAIPRLSGGGLPVPMEGRPPAPGGAGEGCAFAARCPLAEPACTDTPPPITPLADGGMLRCHRPTAAAGQSALHPLSPAAAPTEPGAPVLRLDHIAVRYRRQSLLERLRAAPLPPPVVAEIALALARGETVGLVGESGSGKSTILKAIAGLIPAESGTIDLAGEPLPQRLGQRAPRALRAVQLVFQNPDDSLNPRHTVAEILAQPLRLYSGLTGPALRARAAELLGEVRLGPHYLDRLPGQMSGGEKQRVAIARAFAAEPDVVLCDEITSALDVSVQAAIIALLDRLRRERGVACLFVSHDLAVVRAVAERVVVLYQGRICESGPVAAVYAAPAHPYTEALLGAVLEPDPDHVPLLLAADIVESGPPASGCPAQNRCHRRIGEICRTQAPPTRDLGGGHSVRCHLT